MQLAKLRLLVSRLFGPRVAAEVRPDSPRFEDRSADSPVGDVRELLEPPAVLTDGAAWDRYWENHLRLGFGPTMFDMMIDDGDLVRSMRDARLFTVLCVGNGMSMEPRALAAAGLAVTALDVAPRVTSFASRVPLDDEYIARLLGGTGQRAGGTVEFATGSAFDPIVCPGPFDVIIERRTAQNYAATNSMPQFLAAVARRLAPRGLFVSHFHDGGWRPGKPETHLPGEWFTSNGWPIVRGKHAGPVSRQMAWLIRSTG
jgi:SAM-dependent methyltransferase